MSAIEPTETVVHYAQNTNPANPVTPAIVSITKPQFPGGDSTDTMRIFEADAQRIADALHAALPGGTLDRLTAELMRRAATRLVVTHRR